LKQVNTQLKDIDYIWVTTHPGLLPSLLTWTTLASTISIILNIPIISINHIEAHIFSNFLDRKESEIRFPLVCLTVSWWHNDIYLMKDMWTLEKLGSSIDDAAGEAFDKAAKMMWLSYPWWPIISKLAQEYREKLKEEEKTEKIKNWKKNWLFPRVWLKKDEFNFSFSGLKTSIKNEINKRIKMKENSNCHFCTWHGNQSRANSPWKDNLNILNDSTTSAEWYKLLSLEDKQELSFEIENAIIEVLAWKLIRATKENKVKNVVLAWWVSANISLKAEIQRLSDKEKLNFIYPKKSIYSMDNAAMVGINTYYKIKCRKFERKVGVVKV
jgi:N6-L-threonylcarbamoyladenine synthase